MFTQDLVQVMKTTFSFAVTFLALVRGGIADRTSDDRHSSNSKQMQLRIYNQKSLADWILLLEDPNPLIRASAARAIGHFGSDVEEALPALITSLGGTDEFVRSAAAKTLGKIGPRANIAVPALIQALRRSSYFHQSIIGPAIAGIGQSAVPALLEAARDRDEAVQWQAVRALRMIGPDAHVAIPELHRLTSDIDANIRVEAAFALWMIDRRRDAIAAIAHELDGPIEFSKMSGADYLGEIGPAAASAVPNLIRALDDPSEAVRNRAAAALGKIGPASKDAVLILVQSAGSIKKPIDRRFITQAIAKIGPVAVPALVAGLESRDDVARSVAAESLGMIGPAGKEALRPLVEMMAREPRILMQLAAANALWEIGRDERALPVMVRGLKSDDVSDRFTAMTYLGRIGEPGRDAVPALITILGHEDRFRLPATAAETLGKIGPAAKGAIPALEASLKDSDGLIRVSSALALWRISRTNLAIPNLVRDLRDPDVGYYAAEALSEVGPSAISAIPALVECLESDQTSRAIYAKALGRIGPAAKTAVPSLIKAFDDETAFVKENVIEALRSIDPDEAARKGIRQ